MIVNKAVNCYKNCQDVRTGNEIRDFIQIKDTLKALLLPPTNKKMWNNIYNGGSVTNTKIRDLVSIMLRVLNGSRDILYTGRSWRGDMRATYANIDKIKAIHADYLATLCLRSRIDSCSLSLYSS
jgi:nucleoside-diphosphate-sugar epimerase